MKFVIPLAAKPQGSKKAFLVNGRPVLVEASANLKTLRNNFTEYIRSQANGWAITDKDIPVKVSIFFVFAKPKSVKRKHMTTIPDIDKTARFCCDALTNAGVITDDRQITVLHLEKRYGPKDVTIIEIGEQE